MPYFVMLLPPTTHEPAVAPKLSDNLAPPTQRTLPLATETPGAPASRSGTAGLREPCCPQCPALVVLNFNQLNMPIGEVFSSTRWALNNVHKATIIMRHPAAFTVEVYADISAFPLYPSMRFVFVPLLCIPGFLVCCHSNSLCRCCPTVVR